MHYIIDFDTRSVESESEDKELLSAYIVDNNLSDAVVVISSAEELCFEFSLDEMRELHENISSRKMYIALDEEEASSALWELFDDDQYNFPTFTVCLGKKLLRPSDEKPKPEPKPKSKSLSPRIKLNLEDTITILNTKCKRGSILHTIVTAIDDHLCNNVGEVIDYITSNHVIPKTGELADVKFAEHNIKYFVKKYNLALGREL